MIKKSLLILLLLSHIIPHIIFAQQKEIIAYYPGVYSENHRANEKILDSTGIADKVTILNYAFVYPMPDSTGKIIPYFKNSYFAYQEYYSDDMSVDGIGDDSSQALRGQFNQLRKLKLRHPNLRILLSVGGWGGSKLFSDAALTQESREYFVNSCIDLFIKGNLPKINGAGGKGSGQGIFDGIDLDWEFPIACGPEGTHYNENDRENQTQLFKLFREKLDKIKPGLLLTSAITGRSSEFWQYNFTEDQKYLDWFNLMSYDLHGIVCNVEEKITAHHTNLLSSPNDPNISKESLDRAVQYLIDSAGVDPFKIAPGAAFYGKGWSDVDSINNGLFQKGKFLNKWGYIRFKDFTDYNEINKQGFKVYWDDYSLAAYLYNKEEKIFWTFDDLRSVVLKARYVDSYNLRGLMFWQIFGDDTLNTFVNSIYNKNMPDVKYESEINISHPPKVSVSILNDEILHKGQNIVFTLKTENENCKVVKVEYFVDNNSIGYNTFFPFSWALFNVAEGEHTVYCIAYNNFGVKSISDIVNFSVK